jgi:hypothetical protein
LASSNSSFTVIRPDGAEAFIDLRRPPDPRVSAAYRRSIVVVIVGSEKEASRRITTPTRTEVNGDQVYVVIPAVYTFKERGVAMRESAQMTFALRKGPGGWLIHGWTWTGAKPTASAKK